MSHFAPLPDPPYYAVIFTAMLSDDDAGYSETAAKMRRLAARQPGFIGVEATRGADRLGITVSYWEDEEAVKGWKQASEHLLAQKIGKERWYSHYTLRVAKIERGYDGPKGR